jgi:hypothetical protein
MPNEVLLRTSYDTSTVIMALGLGYIGCISSGERGPNPNRSLVSVKQNLNLGSWR